MNILIVDDEIYALEALAFLLKESSFDFKEIFSCTNITQAKEILKSKEVHFMICDIEMPGGSGIDLVEWMQHDFPDIVTIFLTCHSDFQYASKAIKYGVFDYLLKPILPSDLDDVLKKAVKKYYEKEQQQKQKQTVHYWSANKTIVNEQFWKDFLSGVYQYNDYAYIEWIASQRCIQVEKQTPYFPILFYLFTSTPYVDKNVLSFASLNVITESLLSDSMSPPVVRLSNFYQVALLPNRTLSVKELLQKCLQIKEFLEKYYDVRISYYLGEDTFLTDLPLAVSSLIEQSKSIIAPSDQLPSSPSVLEKIQDFVKTNLYSPITREDVANAVFLNPDYLSKLFKKEMGEGLTSYITRLKIAEAKRLLLQTEIPISTIASDLGYSNFSYFSKLFKKETGKTPNEYRQKSE